MLFWELISLLHTRETKMYLSIADSELAPKGHGDKVLTRLKSLRYMARSTIDKLVTVAPSAQRLSSNYNKYRQQNDNKD